MKLGILFSLPVLVLISACFSGESKEARSNKSTVSAPQDAAITGSEKTLTWEKVNPAGKTIAQRLPTPPGFNRIAAEPNSIGAFLRNLTVKPNGAIIRR